MKTHRLKACLLLAAFSAALAMPAAAASGQGVVTASGLYLRAEASTGSAIRTMAPSSACVTLTGGEMDGWYPVSYNGYTGYMSAEYIKVTQAPDADAEDTDLPETGTVTATQVNVRSAPEIKAGNVLGMVNTGRVLTITGKSGDWYQVDYNGQTGYIIQDYFRPGTAAAATQSTQGLSTVEALLTTAKSFLGTPYVYAGMSPAGFDCSGFVGYVYKQYGYSLSRTAANIYINNGTAVERNDLQPGDLLFFLDSGYSYVGHVGMNLGDGKFIHASSYARSVVIAEASGTWFDSHYVGAKRIIT